MDESPYYDNLGRGNESETQDLRRERQPAEVPALLRQLLRAARVRRAQRRHGRHDQVRRLPDVRRPLRRARRQGRHRLAERPRARPSTPRATQVTAVLEQRARRHDRQVLRRHARQRRRRDRRQGPRHDRADLGDQLLVRLQPDERRRSGSTARRTASPTPSTPTVPPSAPPCAQQLATGQDDVDRQLQRLLERARLPYGLGRRRRPTCTRACSPSRARTT